MRPVQILTAAACLLACAVPVLAARTAPAPRRSAPRQPAPARAAPAPRFTPVTVEEARETAALLDDAYQTILEEVHRTYPTKPGQPVAATIVKQLQETMALKGWPRSRFLAVNALVMNPNHVPHDAFERQAVKELKGTSERVEAVEPGRLRVATSVPVGGTCFSCHWTEPGHKGKAAISFSIPIRPARAAVTSR
jgi:hypothetical protein